MAFDLDCGFTLGDAFGVFAFAGLPLVPVTGALDLTFAAGFLSTPTTA